MEVVVVGTHEYQWALGPFWHLFQCYWPDQHVIYYGDRVEGELPDGLEFRQVPCYSEGNWPWTPWFSNGLRSILNDLTGFIIGLFLPDHWISQPVDVDAVHALAKFMDEKGNVIRGELTRGTCLDGHGKHVATVDGYDIVSVRPDHPHCGLQGGITFSPALWNRALLRNILEPYWSLWETESEGTKRLMRFTPDIYSVGVKALYRCHALYHSRSRKVGLEGLNPEDREAVKGMIPKGWEYE